MSGNKVVATEEDPLLSVEAPPQHQLSTPHHESLLSTLKVFWSLGFICFGGAPAHIAILHEHLVVKHKWVTEELFLELFSLAQALPGPTSTQLAAASAVTRSGFLGGLLVIILFVFPGFFVLLLTGLFLRALVDPANPPIFLLGIPPAAVALICKACYTLGAKLDKLGLALAIFSTTVAVLINGDQHIPLASSQMVYPLLLIIGGLVTLVHSRLRTDRSTSRNEEVTDQLGVIGHEKVSIPLWVGSAIFFSWLALLVGSITMVHRGATNVYLRIFEVCFRTGSIFYGGAIAVIPLLENDVVPRGWLTDQQFLQGLGIAQSMPGPTASLAAFIGSVYKGLAGGLVAEIGLLGPGFLLIFAVIPVWSKLRHTKSFQAILIGVNATAIGFISSACIVLYAKGVHTAADAMVFVIAAGLTMFYNVSAPVAVLVGVVFGVLFSEKVLNLGQLTLK